ncbi:MAG: hypothetical protein H6636_07570 [Anaerolineales bacterium]|nr:hypothetical protein [Anaerolineales bacterium]
MKRFWLPLLFSLFLLGLTACGGTPQADSQTGEVEVAPSKEAAQPFSLDQLVATEPGTVQLSTGKVQLIEFFAYW